VADLVDELETDDARVVVAKLPPELARKVLPELEEQSEVQELLLQYHREIIKDLLSGLGTAFL